MTFQAALNSRNVLVPLGLEDRLGEPMHKALSRLDSATAMVVAVSAGGAFRQDFIPLRIVHDSDAAYAGDEWELRTRKVSGALHAYYLGIPDRCFAASAGGGEPPRSLSVQVVGSSPLSGREEFTGGVDVTLHAQVEAPLIPGFLALAERFFPTLLPHNFVSGAELVDFAFDGGRNLLLAARLRLDPADRLPVSLGKHWNAKSWIGAVVENLASLDEAAAPAWYTIRGGCFYGRNRRLSHWFGGGIGLEHAGFRPAAGECIRALEPGENGAWIFWLEPHGDPAGHYATLRDRNQAARRPLAVRHAMLHRILAAPAESSAAAPGTLADGLSAAAALGALGAMARLLARRQDIVREMLSEPAHDLWSDRANPVVAAALAFEGGAGRLPAAPSTQESLAGEIEALYGGHGEALRALEAHFDEVGGFSPLDSAAHPLREALGGILSAAEARPTA